MANKNFYIWHNGMCISYLLRIKQMENFLLANGWAKTHEPPKAGCIIIGACAAFLPYFDVYASKIKEVSGTRASLIVYGCLPIVNKKFFEENTPKGVNFIPSRSPEHIEKLIPGVKLSWSQIPVPSVFRREDYVDYDPRKSFVLIQEGCNEGCLYCPHKIGIGREKSRPLSDIVKQIQKDVLNGIKTVVLEGNNGGGWGRDLNPPLDYKDLLKAVMDISKDFEVHIGDFAPRWVKKFQDYLINPRITDIKIPIQSVSARLLKKMGRYPDVMGIAPVLEKLKKQRKKPFLRTEIIIGFPTSTKEALLDTLEFTSRYFDKVSCFSYDYYPSTMLGKMDIPFIKDEEIESRIKIAMDFFKDKTGIIAAFDNRGRVCDKVTRGQNLPKK